jgi:hypothetical protein
MHEALEVLNDAASDQPAMVIQLRGEGQSVNTDGLLPAGAELAEGPGGRPYSG